MLSPDVWNVPITKIITREKQVDNLEMAVNEIKRNSFYESVIVTCPGEIFMPELINECITEDSEYYGIISCPLTEFIEKTFVESYVKKGDLYCLSVNEDCVVYNSAAITPDGVLTLNVLDFIYQTIGLEGKKRPKNFYEVKVDLKNIKNYEKCREALRKLGSFNFYLMWEPYDNKICPSSVAKYLCDKGIEVVLENQCISNLTPKIIEIPSIKDVSMSDMTEWIGMLALDCNMDPTETYISSYSQPVSDLAIKSDKIVVLTVKGFLTSNIISTLCERMFQYTSTRDLDNYWTSLSVQSFENTLWQWSEKEPSFFQSVSCSSYLFITNGANDKHTYYCIGQVNYS